MHGRVACGLGSCEALSVVDFVAGRLALAKESHLQAVD